MRNDRENKIVDLTIQFALDIIDYCGILEEKKKFVISRQLLKSGTSIGANVSEAQNGESIHDFVHKMKIAAKEADETKYWIVLCEKSPGLPFNPARKEQLQSIIYILSRIISTSKLKSNT